MLEISGTSLTTCQVAPDGSAIRLNFKSACGQPASLTLPIKCIQQLLMTLPQAASMAIRAKYGDDTLRLIFPLGDWRLEKASGAGELILTLNTADGFEVAFSLAKDAIRQMASGLETKSAPDEADCTYLN